MKFEFSNRYLNKSETPGISKFPQKNKLYTQFNSKLAIFIQQSYSKKKKN